MNLLTFGTAAWKLNPVAATPPDTWKRARIMTTPGLAADVCGVSVIFRSFFSYAGYAVRRCCGGAVAVGGWGGDTVRAAAVGGNDDAGVEGYDGGMAFG